MHDKIKPTVSSLLKTKSSQTQLVSNETICVFAAIKLSSKLRDKVKLINHQRNLHERRYTKNKRCMKISLSNINNFLTLMI